MTRRISSSNLALIIIILLYTLHLLNHIPGNIISWDVFGNYLYLPSYFINDDLLIQDFTPVQNAIDTYKPLPYFYVGYGTELGNTLIKPPMGFAVIFSPFFGLGHLFAGWLGYPQDGYSLPYQMSLLFGTWTYVVLGLVVIRRFLLRLFSDKVVAALIIILALGTNFGFQVVHGSAMPHAYLFLFYGLVLLYTYKWHKNPSVWNSIVLGASLGLMCLCRASELLAVLIPLLWGITDKESFKDKLSFIKQNYKPFATVIGVFILCGFPQFLYWKAVSGHFFVDSYQNNGEGFDLLRPHTIDFLFSYRKGWLLYTPLMLIAIFGLYKIYKSRFEGKWSVLIFTALNIYLLSSWTNWWYAESFGQRSLIQSYAVLLIPMGYGLKWALRERSRLVGFSLFVVLGIGLNIFQTWQLEVGLIHGSRMTKEAYWKHFLSTSFDQDFENTLLIDYAKDPKVYVEESGRFQLTREFSNDFENIEDNRIVKEEANTFCRLNSENIYSLDLSVRYFQLTKTKNPIFKIRARIRVSSDINEVKPVLVSKFRYHGRPYSPSGTDVWVNYPDFSVNEWKWVEFYSHCPVVRSASDDIQVFGMLSGTGSFDIDDLKVEVFEQKRYLN